MRKSLMRKSLVRLNPNLKDRKGVSPIIATILLIGVAVMAVGGIYTFTQGELEGLSSSEAPRANIELVAASRRSNTPFGITGDGNVIVLENKGPDTIDLGTITVRTSVEDDTRTTMEKLRDSGTDWASGGRIAFGDMNDCGGHARVIVSEDSGIAGQCQNYQNKWSEGEEIIVEVVHRPSETTISTDNTEAIYEINSLRN